MAPSQFPHALLLLGALTVSCVSVGRPSLPDDPSPPPPPAPAAKAVENLEEFFMKMAQVSAAPTTEAALDLLGKLFPDEDFSALAQELAFLSKNGSRPLKLPRWPVDVRWRLGKRQLFIISSDPHLSRSLWLEAGSSSRFLFPHQKKDQKASLTLESLQRLCEAGRHARVVAKEDKSMAALDERIRVKRNLGQISLNPTHPHAERVLAQSLPHLHPSEMVTTLKKEMTRLKLGKCALLDWYQASNR